MPSTITGVFPRRILSLNDFQGTAPDDPGVGIKAEAHPDIRPDGVSSEHFEENGETFYRLKDTFTIEVTFDRSASWVIPAVHNDSASEQARLLNHEQGHYDLTALIARDFFVEVMKLKEAKMSTSDEVLNSVVALHGNLGQQAQPLQNLYDNHLQTDHGRHQQKQNDWDGYIQTAFTVERVPRVVAPDGKAHKKPILKVLEDAGISLPNP